MIGHGIPPPKDRPPLNWRLIFAGVMVLLAVMAIAVWIERTFGWPRALTPYPHRWPMYLPVRSEAGSERAPYQQSYSEFFDSGFCISEHFEPVRKWDRTNAAVAAARPRYRTEGSYLDAILREFEVNGYRRTPVDGAPVLQLVIEETPRWRAPYQYVGAAILCPDRAATHTSCNNYTFYFYGKPSPEEAFQWLSPHLEDTSLDSRTCPF